MCHCTATDPPDSGTHTHTHTVTQTHEHTHTQPTGKEEDIGFEAVATAKEGDGHHINGTGCGVVSH